MKPFFGEMFSADDGEYARIDPETRALEHDKTARISRCRERRCLRAMCRGQTTRYDDARISCAFRLVDN